MLAIIVADARTLVICVAAVRPLGRVVPAR